MNFILLIAIFLNKINRFFLYTKVFIKEYFANIKRIHKYPGVDMAFKLNFLFGYGEGKIEMMEELALCLKKAEQEFIKKI